MCLYIYIKDVLGAWFSEKRLTFFFIKTISLVSLSSPLPFTVIDDNSTGLRVVLVQSHVDRPPHLFRNNNNADCKGLLYENVSRK